MKQGELDYAFRKAMETFDKWNDVTGVFEKCGGYYAEIESVIRDAVRIGVMAGRGDMDFFNEDGEIKGGKQ